MTSRLCLTFLVLSLAIPSARACIDPPVGTPPVLVRSTGPGTALLLFPGYTSVSVGPGTFCACALNLVGPITGVTSVRYLNGMTLTPIPQFAFTPNATVGTSFDAVAPGAWAGFFSNVAGSVPAGNEVVIAFDVTLAPGTMYADVEMALRVASVVVATDRAAPSGMVTGTQQSILPAGCIVNIDSPTMSHSADSTFVAPMGSVSCSAMGVHTDNGYFRSYTPSAFGFGAPATVESVTFGIEGAAAGFGASQPVEIRLYLDPTPPNPAPVGGLTLLHTEFLNVADAMLTVMTAPITASPALVISPSDTLVVELFTPDATGGAGHSFFIGANALGQTGPSYIRAAACGVGEPVPMAMVGFPNVHIILDVNFQGAPPPAPATCTLTAPASPAGGDIDVDLIGTTAACVDVFYGIVFSTDAGTTFTACTPAAASPFTNPSGPVAAGAATFVWDSVTDGVGAMGPQSVVLAAQVTDLVTTPTSCSDLLTVDNSALCQLICGDCDTDGSMPTVLDSLAGAQIAVGIIGTPTMAQMGCCDVDSDADIDVLDSLLMAQSATGLPVALTCP